MLRPQSLPLRRRGAIACVVSSRQCSGSTPAGGLTSRASTTRSRTVLGSEWSCSYRGRPSSTSPYRNATTAVRLGLPGSRAGSSITRRPACGKFATAANSMPPSASRRSCMVRVSIWTLASGTEAHLA